MGGQPDDLDFGLSEALDIGESNLGNHGIQQGLYEDDDEEYNLMVFGRQRNVRWTLGVYVSA